MALPVQNVTGPRTALARGWLAFRWVIFVLLHVLVLATPWIVGVRPEWLLLCVVSYYVRMFGVSAGYHRYYSHRTFETSRPFAFLLAWLAQSSNQNGVLWWAARHRHHHRYSDLPADVHSPAHHGLLQSHLTWFMLPENWVVDEALVPDLIGRRELVALQRMPWLPTSTLALALFLWLGWPGLLWGYVVPTVILLHTTFATNSINHLVGARPNDTRDRSTNIGWLAVLTMGEGWHNNHHAAPGSAQLGWRWYEVDPTWRILQGLQGVGLVWDLKGRPSLRHAEAAAPPL